MVNEIENDPFIVKTYNKIEKIQKTRDYADHGWRHINKVVENIKQILKVYDSSLIETGMIAALLHDIGVVDGKSNHAEESCLMATKYLQDKELVNKEMILDAIRYHGNGKDDFHLVGLALVLADKIDFDKNRILPLGMEDPFFLEILNIDDVIIVAKKETLIIKFLVNQNFDRKKMESYYFVDKIFKAVQSFAAYAKIGYQIQINDQEWKKG